MPIISYQKISNDTISLHSRSSDYSCPCSALNGSSAQLLRPFSADAIQNWLSWHEAAELCTLNFIYRFYVVKIKDFCTTFRNWQLTDDNCKNLLQTLKSLNTCSGYLRKETAVVSIVLPFVYRGLAHFAVHLKNSHQKKEEILRWTAKKKEEILRWTAKWLNPW